MAKELANIPNVQAPDADYPQGRPLTGASGTVAGQDLFDDIIITMSKILADSGLTLTDQFDNVTNGFQLLQAMQKVIPQNTDWVNVTTFNGDNTQSSDPNYQLKYRKSNGYVEIEGQFVNVTGNGFILPVGFRPITTIKRPGFINDITNGLETHTIDTLGNVFVAGGASAGAFHVSSRFPI